MRLLLLFAIVTLKVIYTEHYGFKEGKLIPFIAEDNLENGDEVLDEVRFESGGEENVNDGYHAVVKRAPDSFRSNCANGTYRLGTICQFPLG